MNGIICCACLTLAISALQRAPLRWQNELNKNQEKDVSQPNQAYDEFDSEDTFGRVFFNFIKPGECFEWISRSWKICCSMEDPVVLLERNLYGHFLAGLLWERQFEKVLFENMVGEKFQIGNVSFFVHREKRLF